MTAVADSGVDPRIEKATALNSRFSDVVEGFRNNKQLTAEAKRKALAQAWVVTSDEVAKLRNEFLDQADKRRRELEEKHLRPKRPHWAADPAERVARDGSWRDALDRADRADNPEALLRLLRRAQSVGDDIQERAVLAAAFERGPAAYLDVLNAHVGAHPDEEGALQELVESGPMSLSQRVKAEMVFPTPPVPGELGNASEFAIRQIAAGAAAPGGEAAR